jgi:DNA-binding MarR family transcriptional regulator
MGKGGRPRESAVTQRSFRVYLEFLDTADWFRGEASRQLESFDMTLMDFRILEVLHRGEPTFARALARKFQCSTNNVTFVLDRLSERGWVRRGEWSRAPVPPPRPFARARKNKKRPPKGRRVLLVQLTPEGEKAIANVLPKHAKIVKARMKALDGREQEVLGVLCKKLRTGDILKFVKEMMWEDLEETS